MGVIANIDYDNYPEQAEDHGKIGARVKVCYHYDASKYHLGTIVRNDREDPWEMIIKLDNGRYLRAVECQYSIVGEECRE